MQVFTVYYKAVEDKGAWESEDVFEQSVVVLEGLRAHTNYTVRVSIRCSGAVDEVLTSCG